MAIATVSHGNMSVDKHGNHTPNTMDKYLFNDFYIGYKSNTGVSGKIGPVSVGQSGVNLTYTGNTSNYTHATNKPVAYTANAAKTASSIKQGGMTKDEIMDFNIRHPNETMIRGQ